MKGMMVALAITGLFSSPPFGPRRHHSCSDAPRQQKAMIHMLHELVRQSLTYIKGISIAGPMILSAV
jgi:hypothetical protein